MKIALAIVSALVVICAVYAVLGWAGVVPMYHCETAMGPNGPVHWCEWYSGPVRTY